MSGFHTFKGKKKRLPQGQTFFDRAKARKPEGQRINAWRTADAYALYADQPSYAQQHGRHE